MSTHCGTLGRMRSIPIKVFDEWRNNLGRKLGPLPRTLLRIWMERDNSGSGSYWWVDEANFWRLRILTWLYKARRCPPWLPAARRRSLAAKLTSVPRSAQTTRHVNYRIVAQRLRHVAFAPPQSRSRPSLRDP